MYTNNKKTECNAPNSAYEQQQKSDGKGTRRIGALLRVLIPALIISITLIACPDNTPADTTAPIITIDTTSTSAAQTGTSVTVTVTTNETGKLFWVAYTDNTTAPADAAALITAAGQTPDATIIANSGSAGQTVSTTDAQTVMITGLSAETNYDVYLVAQDAAGNNSLLSAKLDIATIADTIAPTISDLSTNTTTEVNATVNVTINETGKLFWVAYVDNTTAPADAAALITAAEQPLSAPIIATSTSAGQTVSKAGAQTVMITGLSAETSYDLFVVAQDAAGNNSTLSAKLDIATTANIPPTVSSVSAGAITGTSATINATVNETGKLFWVAYADGTTAPANAAALITAAGQPLSAIIIANSTSTGQAVSTAGAQTITISGLSDGTNYDVYLVAQDAANNNSALSAKLDIITTPLFFLHTNGITVLCPNAAADATGTVNSVTYTKRVKGTITPTNAAMTCTSGITDMSLLFNAAATFDQDISSWDVSSVTNMNSVFSQAAAFNQDISSWDVSRVTDMSSMFDNADAFNQNIGRWDVGSVTKMKSMFSGTATFNQNIGSWDVSNVTNTAGMFANTPTFNQNIGSWDVGSVTKMGSMFQGIATFNQNIGSWDVSSVTDMGNMFASASIFNQNIGSWDVSSVTDMELIFFGARAFNQNLSGWCVSRFPSEPTLFSFTSALIPTNKPKWGDDLVSSCPLAVSSVSAGTATATSVAVSVTANKTGKLFWVAYVNDTTAPTNAAALITAAGQPIASPIIASSGNTGQPVSTAGTQTVNITGLTTSTPYDVYFVAQDTNDNTSTLSTKLDITTM